MDYLLLYTQQYKLTFITVTESWTRGNVSDSELQLNGYKLFRKDRQTKKEGGVLLYVIDTFNCTLLDNLTYGVYEETAWCKVYLNSSTSLMIGVIYRPPVSNALSEKNLLQLLRNANACKSTFKLIVGDFNFPGIDWVNLSCEPSSDEFLNTVLDLCLAQYVLISTRGDHILDLVFSDYPEIVSNVEILEPLKTSDHQLVICELNLIADTPSESCKTNCLLKDMNYKKADWNKFFYMLQDSDWERIFHLQTEDKMWREFIAILTNIIIASVSRKIHHFNNSPVAYAGFFKEGGFSDVTS